MSMNETDSNAGWTRRAFVERGVAGAAGALAAGSTVARAKAALVAEREDNPWRYDVESLRRVDPALVHYERFVQFAVGNAAPRRLTVGPDGRVAVAAGRSILVFDPDGRRTADMAVGDLARCVGVAADGRYFVGLRDRVEVFDGKGTRVARWKAVGGKAYLTGIAVGERDVFVADSGNRVVYRHDAEGRVQLRIGERNPGGKIPGLVLPSPFLDVELGADGLLRVNNAGRHAVEVYTRDGELEARWGRPGAAIDSFCGCCNPIGLALLEDGRCVTAEKGLPRVKLYTAEGRLESVVAAPSEFAPVHSDERTTTVAETTNDGLDVAVDAAGRVWVLDLVGATVQGYRRRNAEGKAA